MKVEIEIGTIGSTNVEKNLVAEAEKADRLIQGGEGDDFNASTNELIVSLLRVVEYKKLYDEGSR